MTWIKVRIAYQKVHLRCDKKDCLVLSSWSMLFQSVKWETNMKMSSGYTQTHVLRWIQIQCSRLDFYSIIQHHISDKVSLNWQRRNEIINIFQHGTTWMLQKIIRSTIVHLAHIMKIFFSSYLSLLLFHHRWDEVI